MRIKWISAGSLADSFPKLKSNRDCSRPSMDSCGKRFAPAARVLGLHRTTLKKKLTQYEMEHAATE
jgi:DNA-binding NtrC family response regulator